MIRRALVFAIIALASFTGIVYAEGPITLAEYRGVVQQALDLAQRAKVNQPDRQPLLSQASALIENVRAVRLDSGAVVAVDNSALAELINDAAENPDSAVTRLQALRAALDVTPAPVNDADQRTLRDILNKPPFKADNSDWLMRLQIAVREFFNRLLNTTARGIVDLRDVWVGIGVGVFVVVALFFYRNLRRNIVAEEQVKRSEGDEVAMTSKSALNRAQRFAGAGNYREAVRQLYLATLFVLDERGRLRYDHSLTNREFLGAAATEPAVVAALQPIVETFDRTWYGYEPISPTEFEIYRRRVEAAKNL